jgi:hypothetical protein
VTVRAIAIVLRVVEHAEQLSFSAHLAEVAHVGGRATERVRQTKLNEVLRLPRTRHQIELAVRFLVDVEAEPVTEVAA